MNTDDPKFTAHALGELEDLTPAERAEIEALIEADDSRRCGSLRDADARSTAAGGIAGRGSPAAHCRATDRVLAATQARALVKKRKVVPFSRRSLVLSAIAACLIVGLCVWMIHLTMERDRAALQRLAVSEQGMSVPTISMDAVSDPVPEGILLPSDVSQAASASTSTAAASATVASTNAAQMATITTSAASTNSVTMSSVSAPNISLKTTTTTPGAAPAAATVGTGPSKAQAARIGAFTGRYAQRGIVVPDRLADRRVGRDFDTGSGESDASRPQSRSSNTDAFDTITDNAFLAVRESPLSTFSIDVDTASYANVRRFLNEQQLPPKGAVRIEELLNYFTYDYPQPKGDAPFSATMEVADLPVDAGASARAHRAQGPRDREGQTPGEQPRLPHRCLRLDAARRTSCRW